MKGGSQQRRLTVLYTRDLSHPAYGYETNADSSPGFEDSSESLRGELVFTNGSLFIRGTLRIRQVHIYLDRYTCFARYTFFP